MISTPPYPIIGYSISLFMLLFGFGPLLIGIIRAAFMPGQKGRMETTRETIVAPAPPEYLLGLYASRLQYDGFNIKKSRQPNEIYAVTGRIPSEGPTFSGLTISARLELHPDPAGVRVRLTLWYSARFFADTGETAYLNQLLERQLAGELAAPRPVRESPSMKAGLILYTGALLLLSAFLAFIPAFTPDWTLGLMFGQIFGGVLLCIWTPFLIYDVLTKPQLCRNAKIAIYGVLLAAAALTIDFSYTWPRQRPVWRTMMDETRAYAKHHPDA